MVTLSVPFTMIVITTSSSFLIPTRFKLSPISNFRLVMSRRCWLADGTTLNVPTYSALFVSVVLVAPGRFTNTSSCTKLSLTTSIPSIVSTSSECSGLFAPIADGRCTRATSFLPSSIVPLRGEGPTNGTPEAMAACRALPFETGTGENRIHNLSELTLLYL